MKKTLILCFIHGFKGGDDTFGVNSKFTNDLRSLVQEELPKIDIKVLVYPKYETRGDLGDSVHRFREWLLEKVIDIEVAAGTPSPTVDPSVRTILIGHSMGGIVAAETVIGLTSDQPVYSEDGVEKSADGPPSFNSLMFPYVQGVLAFDTPYLGISPGVVAHGAEGHYVAASAAMTQLSGLGTALWGATAKPGTPARQQQQPLAALPAPEENTAKKDGGGGGGWGNWGRVAAIAGGAAAVAAGGAAAYMNRDHLTQGWSWASSHLEFVGCLARGAELQKRVRYMARLDDELGVGFANLYTRLGRAAGARDAGAAAGVVGTVLGPDRTFCNLPKKGEGASVGVWKAAVNDDATDETGAHTAMFEPGKNPGYRALAVDAKTLIARWTRNDWYESSGVADDRLIDFGEGEAEAKREEPVVSEQQQQRPGSPGQGQQQQQQSQTQGGKGGGMFDGLDDNPWA